MTTQPSPRPIRTHILAYLFFLAVAVLITWPLVTVLGTHFAGYDFGDAHEMTRHIWWFKYASQHGQPLIFQPLLGYPDGMQGVILWSDPLQFFPGWLLAFFMPLPAAYNIQSLLNLALNGWAAYFLLWRLTQNRHAALLSGVVFLAAPTIQGHLAGGHGGLLVQWPLPLCAWALLALRDASRQLPVPPNDVSVASLATGNWRLKTRLSPSTFYLALSTLFFVLLPFGHTLQLIYAALPLTAVVGVTLLVERNWRALTGLIIAVGLGTVILGIFLYPVFSATFGTSAYTDEGGGVAYSIDALALLTPSFNHPVYGGMEYTHRVLGTNIVEGSSYIGLVAGILAIIGLVKYRAARWWLLVAVVAWVLALGPLLKLFDTPVTLRNAEYTTFFTLPWALLADLPGFNLARTPGRFNFLIALAVAVMAGYGASVLFSAISRQRSKAQSSVEEQPPISPENPPSSLETGNWKPTPHLAPRTLIFALLATLILLDYQSFWPLPTYSAGIPQAVRDLSTREDVRAVFDMPWDNLLAAKDSLWLQTAHEKPIIAGQVTRRTPVSPAKLTILEGTLNPALLDEAGADVVILHKTYDYDGQLGTLAREKLGEPTYEDARIAMWDAPEAAQPAPMLTVMPSGMAIDGVSEFIRPEGLPFGVDQANLYVYTPEPGWLNLNLHINSSAGKNVVLLDGQPIYTRHTNSFADNTEIPLAQPGYHTITVATQPACPVYHDSSWICGFLEASTVSVPRTFTPDVLNRLIIFDRGVTLNGAHIELGESKVLTLLLWWQFSQPRSEQDIRFVKVLDENGEQVAGWDMSPGAQATDSQMTDPVTITLSDVPPGTYRVVVGWYSYPDLTRFPVLSDVPGAQDGLAQIGEFTIPETP